MEGNGIADSKTLKMAQFYEQCQAKGYTDMSDEAQALKAKVIAADLGLNYGKIADFYAKAEKAFLQVSAEREEARKEQELVQRLRVEAAARDAAPGELLLTLSDSRFSVEDGTVLRVYLRPDRSIYTTVDNGEKQEGAPIIIANHGGVVETTYHPSQTVFTGAAVGGVATGGFHQTQAYASDRLQKTGTGYLTAGIGKLRITVLRAAASQRACEAFKRDSEFCRLMSTGLMICYLAGGNGDVFAQASRFAQDYGTRSTMLSMAADKSRLPYELCEEQAELLTRIASGLFPPTDQELYDRALSLTQSGKTSDLKEALDLLEKISDYRDAKAKADALRPRYEEMIQEQKERAVLQKEAKKKTLKNVLIAGLCLVLLAAAAIGFFSVRAKKAAQALVPAVTAQKWEYHPPMTVYSVYSFEADGRMSYLVYKEQRVSGTNRYEYQRTNSYEGSYKILSVKDSVVTIRVDVESGRYNKDGVHWADDPGAQSVLTVELDLDQGIITEVVRK